MLIPIPRSKKTPDRYVLSLPPRVGIGQFARLLPSLDVVANSHAPSPESNPWIMVSPRIGGKWGGHELIPRYPSKPWEALGSLLASARACKGRGGILQYRPIEN